MSLSRMSLLSSAASVTLALAHPAVAQQQVAAEEEYTRPSPYVAGDMHNHTTCTDGSVSTSYLLDRSLGTGTNNGIPNFNIDWFTHGNHGGSGNRDCRFSDTSANLPGDTTTFWTDTLGQTIQDITINKLLGDVPNPPPARANMYRWQSIRDVEYPIITAKAKQYKKVVIEGLETITPGHEHTDTTVLNGQFAPQGAGNANRMAEFEYRFDRTDADTLGPVDARGAPLWPGKSFDNTGIAGHQKAVQSVQWLQANAPVTSYYVPTHTERAGAFNPTGNAGFNIEHFRDFNNAGPTVAFGIESPGHAADATHSYSATSLGGSTFGGSGIYTAKLGGLWDGMLGEGRNTFFFQSSDWHNRGVFGARDRASTADFFPGEYSRLYVRNRQVFRAQNVVDGMRSGNSFSVSGDLIGPNFTFQASVNGVSKGMGETLQVQPGDRIEVEMRLFMPQSNNSPYGFNNPLLRQVGVFQPINKPIVDHVDLIRGSITGLIKPTDANYAQPNRAETVYNPSTVVLSTFNKNNSAIRQTQNGLRMTFTTTITADDKPFYIRARGTNMPPAVPFVTDSAGNPLPDTGIINVVCADPDCPAHLPTVDGTRRVKTDVEAWSNLWFYANPIFVRPSGQPKLQVEVASDIADRIRPRQQAQD
jgi:hypothetical protein